uniref:Uncharacterized protein n=1 Tax=Arundo donax TaxID=35708 RepID=A0A0A9ACM3_ARUDO
MGRAFPNIILVITMVIFMQHLSTNQHGMVESAVVSTDLSSCLPGSNYQTGIGPFCFLLSLGTIKFCAT